MYVAAYFNRSASAADVRSAFNEHAVIHVFRSAAIYRDERGFWVNGRFSDAEPTWLIPQLRMAAGQSALIASIGETDPPTTDRIVTSSGSSLHRLEPKSLGEAEIVRLFDALTAAGLMPPDTAKKPVLPARLIAFAWVAALLLIVTGRVFYYASYHPYTIPGIDGYEIGGGALRPSVWITDAGIAFLILAFIGQNQVKKAWIPLIAAIVYTVFSLFFPSRTHQ